MGVYHIETTSPAIATAVAIVSAHGLTDLDSLRWVVPYAVFSALPLPGHVVTALFCGMSVLHFSEDVSPDASFALHAAIAAVGLAFGKQAAFRAMLVYLTLVHVPLHYTRCLKRKRHTALRIAAVGTVAALWLARRTPHTLPLTHPIQRIVIAHIAHELAIAEAHSSISESASTSSTSSASFLWTAWLPTSSHTHASRK